MKSVIINLIKLISLSNVSFSCNFSMTYSLEHYKYLNSKQNVYCYYKVCYQTDTQNSF